MWPLPCKPEALAAASTGFVRGGAGVLLDSCINKYVNRFPSCGVRITGAMFNSAPLRTGCWRTLQRDVATGHLGSGTAVMGHLVGVLLAGAPTHLPN